MPSFPASRPGARLTSAAPRRKSPPTAPRGRPDPSCSSCGPWRSRGAAAAARLFRRKAGTSVRRPPAWAGHSSRRRGPPAAVPGPSVRPGVDGACFKRGSLRLHPSSASSQQKILWRCRVRRTWQCGTRSHTPRLALTLQSVLHLHLFNKCHSSQ